MQAFFRAIASVLCRWLNFVCGRSVARQLERQTEDGHTRWDLSNAGAEIGTGETQTTATQDEDEHQPSPVGDVAPNEVSETVESREDPSVGAALDSGASIESNLVTAGRCDEDRQPVKEYSENQELADAPIGTSGSATRRDNDTGGGPEVEPVPPLAKSEKTQEGSNGNTGTTSNERPVGGKNHSATHGEPGSAERPDITTVHIAGSERLAEPIAATPSPEVGTTRIGATASCAGSAEPTADTLQTEALEQAACPSPPIPAYDEGNENNRTCRTASGKQNEAGFGRTVDAQSKGDGPNASAAGMTPCPRCGTTCLPGEIEQVFGYRTMRWTTADGESTAVRRQSYCRRCRQEHAAEKRRRTDIGERSDEQISGDSGSDPTHDEHRHTEDGGLERAPPHYRPPTGRPPSPPEPRQIQTTPAHTASPRADVAVRILFQHDGYCTVSLLAKRLPGLPEEVTVFSESGEVGLDALQDEWYQVFPDNLADLLRTGFVWTGRGINQEWVLSAGREVFVLAPGTAHRGFVSCPRLTLGRDHVVLCAATRLPAVEDALDEAGCSGWSQLGEDDGVPTGWRVLRNVRPRRPVPLDNDADVLNVLRPLPKIEIALEGGIRLFYNTWLLGYPPAIRVYGDPEHSETVLIDDQKAVGSDRNGYTAPGWDREGGHKIWCSSTKKSYSLVCCEANWAFWPAYSFSLRDTLGEDCEFAFCGPLVRPAANDAQQDQRGTLLVPPGNPALLGARPGEIFFVHRRSDVRGAQCLGLPPFDPVWALPAQPLRCDKRNNRILLIGKPEAMPGDAGNRQPAEDSHDLEQWCRIILDASRKGLAVEPAPPATHQLWRSYKHLARRLWKRLR